MCCCSFASLTGVWLYGSRSVSSFSGHRSSCKAGRGFHPRTQRGRQVRRQHQQRWQHLRFEHRRRLQLFPPFRRGPRHSVLLCRHSFVGEEERSASGLRRWSGQPWRRSQVELRGGTPQLRSHHPPHGADRRNQEGFQHGSRHLELGKPSRTCFRSFHSVR